MHKYNSIPLLENIPIDDMVCGKVVSVVSLDGGANSKIFKLNVDDGKEYALKLYLGNTSEGNSRLDREFSSLQFLNAIGIECVPIPVTANSEYSCGIYSFIDGYKIDSADVTCTDIDQVANFLYSLNELGMDSKTFLFPNASEACFSVYSIIDNIKRRLTKLYRTDLDIPESDLVLTFLDTEFIPALEIVESWCRQHVTINGQDVKQELSDDEKILSPSDIGFHNCLKTKAGGLMFLDFEYFGWDDPAKMISDFLLHPAMDLTDNLKSHFSYSIISRMDSCGGLYNRVQTVYPLFGLKWCLIMLNICLPEYRMSKGIVNNDMYSSRYLIDEQLTKSKKMLEKVWREYERFPFGYN